MKKKSILLLFLLCVTSLLLVGCGEKDADKETEKESTKTEKKEESNLKTMSCTLYDEEEEGLMMSMSMDFEYDSTKKEVVSSHLTTTFNFEAVDISDEEMEMLQNYDFCSDAEFNDFSDYAKSCNTNVKGKTVTSVIDLDVDKLDEASDEEDTFRKDMTLEEIKESLSSQYEDEEVTCTIK